MTHPLIRTLNRITQMEANMTEKRRADEFNRKVFEANNRLNAQWQQAAVDRAEAPNDRREGYADGVSGNWQSCRTDEYNQAQQDGAFDRAMLAMAAEWKRRAGLAATSENG